MYHRGCRRSSAIVDLWVFCGSNIVPRGYFVRPNFILMVISWVQNFFSWVFHGSETFSRGSKIFPSGYFVRPKFFPVVISWVQNFFSWLISLFTCFQLLGAWESEREWQKTEYRNTSQTTYSFPNRFQQLSIVSIKKVLYLLNYLRNTQLSFVLMVFLGMTFTFLQF